MSKKRIEIAKFKDFGEALDILLFEGIVSYQEFLRALARHSNTTLRAQDVRVKYWINGHHAPTLETILIILDIFDYVLVFEKKVS